MKIISYSLILICSITLVTFNTNWMHTRWLSIGQNWKEKDTNFNRNSIDSRMVDYSFCITNWNDLCRSIALWFRIRNCWSTSQSLYIRSDTTTFAGNADGAFICGTFIWCFNAIHTWSISVMANVIICVMYCANTCINWNVYAPRDSKFPHNTSKARKSLKVIDKIAWQLL